MNRFTAILRQRCPICLQGKVFQSLLGMNKACPVCGLHFERETGYFLNAMLFAYVLGFLILVPLTLLLYFLDASIAIFSLIIIVTMAVFWPLIFRYSRVIWLHVDQLLDPRTAPNCEE